MDITAEIFASEAQVFPSDDVAVNIPEGFLSEWWSFSYDIHSVEISNHPNSGEGSSSQATQHAGDASHNGHPAVPTPDVNYMIQNDSPAMLMPPPPRVRTQIMPRTFLSAKLSVQQ